MRFSLGESLGTRVVSLWESVLVTRFQTTKPSETGFRGQPRNRGSQSTSESR